MCTFALQVFLLYFVASWWLKEYKLFFTNLKCQIYKEIEQIYKYNIYIYYFNIM